jgi:hypothetical protein
VCLCNSCIPVNTPYVPETISNMAILMHAPSLRSYLWRVLHASKSRLYQFKMDKGRGERLPKGWIHSLVLARALIYSLSRAHGMGWNRIGLTARLKQQATGLRFMLTPSSSTFVGAPSITPLSPPREIVAKAISPYLCRYAPTLLFSSARWKRKWGSACWPLILPH